MIELTTERLRMRRLTLEDAPFILRLVNEPSWLEFIGDKRVRTLDDAHRYLRSGPLDLYHRCGFGPLCVERTSDGAAMGICGLIKRPALPDVDIGFAFLPEYWGQGYAYESAAAVLAQGRAKFGITRTLAITSPQNVRSIRLIERLGLRYEETRDVLGDGRLSHVYGLSDPK